MWAESGKNKNIKEIEHKLRKEEIRRDNKNISSGQKIIYIHITNPTNQPQGTNSAITSFLHPFLPTACSVHVHSIH